MARRTKFWFVHLLFFGLGWPILARTQVPLQPAPADPMAIGKQALQQERWSDAEKFFTNFVHHNPNNPEAEFYQGFAVFGEKRFVDAEQIFLRLIATNPKAWFAHSSLAEVYAAEERWPDFDRERKLIREARDRGEPGTSRNASDVIDVLYVANERYIVRAFHTLDGRVHTRYRFMHFDPQQKMDAWFACESDDIDQTGFAKQHPDLAAKGERSFSLDSYNAPVTLPNAEQKRSEALIKFYWDGEPTYETVRADVLNVLRQKASPMNTGTTPVPAAK